MYYVTPSNKSTKAFEDLDKAYSYLADHMYIKANRSQVAAHFKNNDKLWVSYGFVTGLIEKR